MFFYALKQERVLVVLDKVRIDSIDYTIQENEEYPIVNGRQCIGCIEYDNNSINIFSKLGEEKKKQTLLHEIMHGIQVERNICIATKDSEEDVIDQLASGVLNLIRDNPDLIKYLIRSDE